MRQFINNKLIVLVFYAIAELTAFCGTASEGQDGGKCSEVQAADKVKLVLQTDKSKYKRDEPIQLFVGIENIGNEPVYIKGIRSLDLHIDDCYMKLDVFLSDGVLAPYERYVVDAAGGPRPKDVKEIVKTHYMVLTPEYFHGKTEVIRPKNRGMTKAGKYLLVVTYYDCEPTGWSAKEKAGLKYYVVGGKLKSNAAEATKSAHSVPALIISLAF